MSSNGSPSSEKRIVFLDSLRAIAVLIVLWGHVLIVGINDPATVSIWVPDIKSLGFGPTTAADNIHGHINLWFVLNLGVGAGGLGVSLFFIVSGFVILRTLDRTPPIPFMIQRFFRIVPVCFFCVALVAGITYIYCANRGLTQPNSVTSIVTSAFAANYFNGAFSTVPVLWTLEVEMIFYVVMALSVAAFRRLEYKELILISLLCLLFVAMFESSGGAGNNRSEIFRHFSSISVHISYMMIGALIYRAYESEFGCRSIAMVVVASVIYVCCFLVYGKATDYINIGSNIQSAMAALVIFFLGLFIGMQGKLFAPLRWIASISYPLYLLHIPLAWMMLYVCASIGFGMTTSSIIAILIVVFLAWVTHKAVELPSVALRKKLSKYGRRNISNMLLAS